MLVSREARNAYTGLSFERGGSLTALGKTGSNPAGDAAPRPASGASTATVVGSGTRFVGDLLGDGDVLVEGHLEGRIRVESNVKVGLAGDVQGDVEARSVTVLGRVRGQILASERAELASSATVEGSVQAPKILIAEGAQLDGNVTMSSQGPAPRKSEE